MRQIAFSGTKCAMVGVRSSVVKHGWLPGLPRVNSVPLEAAPGR
jgi:hypothetical protein